MFYVDVAKAVERAGLDMIRKEGQKLEGFSTVDNFVDIYRQIWKIILYEIK